MSTFGESCSDDQEPIVGLSHRGNFVFYHDPNAVAPDNRPFYSEYMYGFHQSHEPDLVHEVLPEYEQRNYINPADGPWNPIQYPRRYLDFGEVVPTFPRGLPSPLPTFSVSPVSISEVRIASRNELSCCLYTRWILDSFKFFCGNANEAKYRTSEIPLAWSDPQRSAQ